MNSYAYVNIDPASFNQKEALIDLTRNLNSRGIEVIASEEPCNKIPVLLTCGPFLYYKNPYVRMQDAAGVLGFHQTEDFSNIYFNEDIVSINLSKQDSPYNYRFKCDTYQLPENIFGSISVHKKEKALIAFVQDGTPYMDMWFKYYRHYFSDEDIYLICCNSPPALLERYECQKLIRNVSIYNMYDKLPVINKIQKELLNQYSTVVYADLDEIIYHPDGLDSVISKTTFRATKCCGYEVIHLKDLEPALNLDLPIAHQRSYWTRHPSYDKPLIIKEPLAWVPGLHGLENDVAASYDQLLLLHLRHVDYDIAYQLNLKNKKQEAPVGGGHHNFKLGDEFDEWWDKFASEAVLIPESIKQGFNF